MQLFVGVWPPPAVRRVLADLPRPDVADVRWSTPDQWLVKLRPLGHVADAVVDPLVAALRFELDGAPKAKASFGATYRDQWLTVEVLGLEELGRVVFEATEPLVPVTHRSTWSAQVVLARARSVPKELARPLTASWTVGEVVLARGTRSKGGPGYETVEAFPLG